MKKKLKIRYLILIIAVITGFTCIFTISVQGKPTKLFTEGEGILNYWQPQDEWMEDGVYHIRDYREYIIFGTIDGIDFTGHIEANSHFIIETTGHFTAHFKVTSYLTWNGLVGTFYGTSNEKGFMVNIPWEPGDYNGKFVFQGAGDFNGWKHFGIFWMIEKARYGFNGTYLIPN